MNNGQSHPEWELYALGLLNAEEHEALSRRLTSGDPVAQREYQSAVEVMHALAYSAPEAVPGANVEAALRRRLQPERPRLYRWLRRPALPWQLTAAACLIACTILGGVIYRQHQQLKQELQRLQSTPAAAAAAVAPVAAPPEVSIPAATPDREKAAVDASNQLRAEFAAIRKQLSDLEQRRAQAEAQSREAEDRLAALTREREQLQAEVAALRSAPAPAVAAPTNSEAEQALRRQLTESEQHVAQLEAAAQSNRRLLHFFQSGPVQPIELRGIDVGAGKAHALALYSPTQGILLFAHDLPSLGADKCYQLWALRKANPPIVSVGILKTDETGAGYLYASASPTLIAMTGLSITDEPLGGSRSAVGRKLLFGALR